MASQASQSSDLSAHLQLRIFTHTSRLWPDVYKSQDIMSSQLIFTFDFQQSVLPNWDKKKAGGMIMI